MDSKTTLANLNQAVEDNDFAAFNREYVDFLKQYDSFKASYSSTPAELEVTNAIFGNRSFFLKQTTDVQAEKLLKNARAASKVLGKMTIEERLDFLNVLEQKLAAHQEELMITITADTGKPIDLSKGEMTKGNEWFKYARDEAAKQIGDKKIDERTTLKSVPQGAVQMIGAFNYPYALAISGIVGGLAAGNGVVVSAPLKAPNWVFPFMEAAKEAIAEYGAKAKADGKEWADEFTQNAGGILQHSVGVNRNLTANVDVVHFVGGDVTGEIIRKSRGQKRTVLEMGGSNVVTVMASAVTDEKKAQDIAKTIFGGFGPATGQRCTAPRMLCMQEGAEAVTKALKDICDKGMAPGTEIGNPFKAGVKMGPLVDRGAHQRMKETIALAKELGAEVHGELHVSDNIVPQARNESSYWVNPIVIDWSNVDMGNADNAKRIHDCMKDEIFGPLVHIVHPVKTIDDAIAMTNKLDNHGLAGAIFTADQSEMDKYSNGTNITSLTVNGVPKDWSPEGPHGHPGLDTIGGDHHFKAYISERIVRQMGNGITIGGGTAVAGVGR